MDGIWAVSTRVRIDADTVFGPVTPSGSARVALTSYSVPASSPTMLALHWSMNVFVKLFGLLLTTFRRSTVIAIPCFQTPPGTRYWRVALLLVFSSFWKVRYTLMDS